MLYKIAAKKKLSKEEQRKIVGNDIILGTLLGAAYGAHRGGGAAEIIDKTLMGFGLGAASGLIDATHRRMRGYGYGGHEPIKAQAELGATLGGILGLLGGAHTGGLRTVAKNGAIGAGLGGVGGSAIGAYQALLENTINP